MRNLPRSCGPDAGRGRDTIRVDFGLALLRSVSVNLAELRRAPAAGGLVALLRSVSVNLAELRRAPRPGGLVALLRSVSVNLAELRRV
jgi:hypothetical protein